MSPEQFLTRSREIRILNAIIAKLAHQALEQRLSQQNVGISALQYQMLRMLSHEQYTLSELSRRLALDPSTLVPVVDTLEGKGLVRRERDPQDRRRVPLCLTKDGAKLLSCVPSAHEDDPVHQALLAMGDEKAQRLLALLRELLHHMPDGDNILRTVSLIVQSHMAIGDTENRESE